MNSKRKKTKIDLKFLKEVLSVQSKSYHEERMVKFITDYLEKIKLPFHKDTYGNIYITKGKADTYPCIVAHMDTVHTMIPVEDFRIMDIDNEVLFAMDISVGKQIGVGGDDKNGIYTALQALQDLKYIKVVLFSNEEVGKIGSTYSIDNHKEFYADCSFVLQADRRDADEFITNSGGINMVSDEFLEATKPIVDSYGYKKAVGLTTDVDTLVKKGIGISCVNLGCGYYRPHSDTEVVVVSEIENVYNLMLDICRELGKTKFTHVYTPPPPFDYSKYRSVSERTGPHTCSAPESIIFKKTDKRLIWDDYMLRPSEYKIFSNIRPLYREYLVDEVEDLDQLNKIFVLNANVNIINTNLSCKDCGAKDVYYVLDEDAFYCAKCGKYVKTHSSEEDALYQKMRIKEEGEYFVFNNTNTIWIKEKDAKWVPNYSTYELIK